MGPSYMPLIRKREINGFNARGTALVQTEAPLGDVVVMTNPVHQLPAAVVEAPAPVPVKAIRMVGKVAAGAAPQDRNPDSPGSARHVCPILSV